ncbi:MAG: hypothetical protein QOE69_1636 [Thermoleophilaceae bacterium]|jgi:hypothetical protein|nr:hypothetical protein [Thermoleophilaceae bacterium]
MPGWPHFTDEFASPNPPEEVHRNVVTKLAPALASTGYALGDHTERGAVFARRYWPGLAIVGFLVGWGLAATGYSNAQDNVLDNSVPPGVYLAAAVAIGCLFVRRHQELRLTFERRRGGTVVLVDGYAKRQTQEMFREVRDESVRPQDLPKLSDPSAAEGPSKPDALDKLKRLAELRDAGALTEPEFEEQKTKLLGQV